MWKDHKKNDCLTIKSLVVSNLPRSYPNEGVSRSPIYGLYGGAPDRRSPLTALAQPPSDTTHVSVTNPPHPALPPSGTNPAPSPYYPMPRLPPPPFPPFIPSRAFRTLSTTPSVLVPCQPPTLVLSFTVPHCAPFRQSSVLQTSADPGLLITCAFYTPPALN